MTNVTDWVHAREKNIYSESLVDKESDFEHITADKSKPVGNNLSIYSIPVQMYINSIYM